MGKKLDALLGRNFKTSKFKATVNLAISRLTIFKNQRQARLSMARSDLIQLLNLGHHERALIRVEQVIKELNMLDVFVMIEGYCLQLIERVNLIAQEKVCPDDLEEAVSSLLYAATRCGEFPELQEIRAVLTSRFGKEFANRAIELRNNCGVDLKMIQKLSTRQSSLESRLKMLREIASENGIVLQIEEASSPTKEDKLDVDQKQNHPEPEATMNSRGTNFEENLPILPKEMEEVVSFPESMKGRKKFRDVEDAAQAAFESAAYAAAAARAAVELSRSESFDPDDQDSPNSWPRKGYTHDAMKTKFYSREEKELRGNEDLNVGLGFEKIHPIQKYDSESDDEEIRIENKAGGRKKSKNTTGFMRSISGSSSDSTGKILEGTILSSDVEKLLEGKEINFDESDDETASGQNGFLLSRNHDLGFDVKHSSLANEILSSEKSNTVKDEDMVGGGGVKIPLRSQGDLKVESGHGNTKSHFAEGSRMAPRLNLENRPISTRTRRVYGR